MPRERFRPEGSIAKLREADVLLGRGKEVGGGRQRARVERGQVGDDLLDREVFRSLRGRRSCSVRGAALDGRRHHDAVRPRPALG
ncbi:MAG TPA: hypothetical protein VFY87_09425 [Geminicoccaceae bacterium]|nr:hypothetical protein [Geminicoccaceae bacterium]